MIRTSATASMSPISSRPHGWPLTATAWEQLEAELVRLKAEVACLATSGPGDANEADQHLLHLPLARAGKRLQRLRQVAADATVTDDQERAVIGRRVTLREADGGVVDYMLVLPGDGNPSRGLISADSPLGSAILYCRPGDTAEIDAPVGRHSVTVELID